MPAFISRKLLQTNSPQYTYKANQEHPIHEGYVYFSLFLKLVLRPGFEPGMAD